MVKKEAGERGESQLRESTRVSFPEATPLILFRREKETSGFAIEINATFQQLSIDFSRFFLSFFFRT